MSFLRSLPRPTRSRARIPQKWILVLRLEYAHSRAFISRFAKRSGLAEFTRGLRDISAFMPEIVRYRAAQIGVGDIVRVICGLRQIPARNLVLPLGTGIDRFDPSLDTRI